MTNNKENNIVCSDCKVAFDDRDSYMEHRKYPCETKDAYAIPIGYPIKKTRKPYAEFPNTCTIGECDFVGKNAQSLTVHLNAKHHMTIEQMLKNEGLPTAWEGPINPIKSSIPISNVVIKFCTKCETIWDGIEPIKFCPDCGTELKVPKKRKSFRLC